MKDKQILQNLRESLTEALEHARGKVTLKMRDSPMPAPGVAITVQCLRDRLWYIHVCFSLMIMGNYRNLGYTASVVSPNCIDI